MALKRLIQSITDKEWKLVAILSLALIFITSFPLVYGLINTPPDQVFTAQHFVSADDWFVYYSFINQAKDGQFLFYDLFAPIDHVPVLRPLWLSVGLFAGIFNLDAALAFHLIRIGLIPIFFFIAYLFIARVFSDKRKRKMALAFLSFSSGLGTLFIFRLAQFPLNYANGNFQWPMDLWVPDINTFLTLFTSPHFIAANILLLIIFLSSLLFLEDKNHWYSVLAGFSGLVLFSFHPFQVIKVFSILAVFGLILVWRDKKINYPFVGHGLIFFAISLPSISYYLYLMRFDLLTAQRALQNINPTTPFYLTLISFGGLLFFSIFGIYFLDKEKKIFQSKYLFVATWLIVQMVLFYIPVSYQRRLGLGIHFPLVILTVYALDRIYQEYSIQIKKNIGWVAVALSLVFLPSTFFALAADLMVFSQAREFSYLSNDVYQGFIWLKNNSPQGSVVFSAVRTGNVLPAYALRASYVGHAVETPFYTIKKKEPVEFFKKNRDQETEKNYLKKNGIDYLFFGELEKELGSYNPADKYYLKKVYSSPSASIYQVL